MSKVRSNILLIASLLFALLLLLNSAPAAKGQPNTTPVVGLMVSAENYPAFARANRTAIQRTLDYDSFKWVIINEADSLRQATSSAASSYDLILGERIVNQAATPSAASRWDYQTRTGNDLHLIQFVGPTKGAWLTALEKSGLEIVQYIHPFTYVVWGERAIVEGGDSAESARQASPIAALYAQDLIRYRAPFAPAYRVLPNHRTPTGDQQFNLLIYINADQSAIQSQLNAITEQPIEFAAIGTTWLTTQLTLNAEQLAASAQIAGIYSIQPVPQDGGQRSELINQISANNVTNGVPFPGYKSWLNALGLSGDGVIVANIDLGVQETHPDLIGRFNVPCYGATCAGAASDAHGTHTAGIIAGDGSSAQSDTRGFMRGMGVAPGVSLIEQIYDPIYLQADGLSTLIEASSHNGALVSSNSWGTTSTPQGYDSATLQVDIGVRDARGDLTGNQPINYVLAFMNGYGGTSSQGSPDEAKNAFTIGSTKAREANAAPAYSINNLSSNSGHGPALDGRTIPNMVAPGCWVDSTKPSSQYGLLCGTSMAAPHVSGAVALFIEQYKANTGTTPSPALVKAAFTGAAHNLTGHRDADNNPITARFSSKQGWGRLDLERVLDSAESVLYYDQSVLFTMTGQQWQTVIEPADKSKPIRIMMAYTDAPGHGLGGSTPAWANNLDLEVSIGSDTYNGNNFDANGMSTTSTLRDYKNNLEGIFLPALTPAFTLRIRASNLSANGVPFNQSNSDQDFALVCYNCAKPQAASQITKAVSTIDAVPGAIVTYTISHQLTYTGTGTVTTKITDTLPAELIVLTDTIQIDGVSQPTVYNPIDHTLAIATNSPATLHITYATVVRRNVTTGVFITNHVIAQTAVDGLAMPNAEEALARFKTKPVYRSFMPILVTH